MKLRRFLLILEEVAVFNYEAGNIVSYGHQINKKIYYYNKLCVFVPVSLA